MSESTKLVATDPQRLLVLDGHSMAFRAFFALPADKFSTATGQHTNAVHGFTSMLINLIKEQKPTHVAVAFDSPTPPRRKAEYSEYKGGRNETPREMSGQIDLIDKVMGAVGHQDHQDARLGSRRHPGHPRRHGGKGRLTRCCWSPATATPSS